MTLVPIGTRAGYANSVSGVAASDSVVDTRDTHLRTYEPLRDLTLYRKFASLRTEELERESVQFANRYGLLGRDVILHPVSSRTWPVHGESMQRWHSEIDKMGVLLVLWDWIRKRDAGKLGQVVIWGSPEHVLINFKWRSIKGKYEILQISKEDESISEEGQHDYWERSGYFPLFDLLANDSTLSQTEKPSAFFRQYRVGDVIGPAKHYLCDMINRHLLEITPTLNPWLGGKMALMPHALLDALWLMFMLEVNGEIRTCWHCGGSLDPSRKDNVYCSNACKRMAFYYAKQRRSAK